MKKQILTLVFLILSLCRLNAQAYLDKQLPYLTGITAALSDQQGYLFLSTKTTAASKLIYLVHTDFNGDTTWTSSAGLAGKEYTPVFIAKGGAFGGYIVAGSVCDSLNRFRANTDAFVAQFDMNGQLKNTAVFGDPLKQESIAQCLLNVDGSIIMAGTIYGAKSQGGLYCLKVNPAGAAFQKVWEQTYTSEYPSTPGFFNWIILKAKSGYWICYKDNGTIFSRFSHIVKIDGSGNKAWSKSYGWANYTRFPVDSYEEDIYALFSRTANDFIGVGTAYNQSFNTRTKPIHFFCLDSMGNTKWDKAYGDTNTFPQPSWQFTSCILKKPDSTYSIIGTRNSYRGFSFCFNAQGDSLGLQNYYYKRSGSNTFSGALIDYDKKPFLYGSTGNSAWILRTDSLCGEPATGAATADLQRVEINKFLKIYPNPVTNGILYLDNAEANTNIEFYNLLGEKVLHAKAAESIDVSGFAKGIYFLKIQSGSEVITRKLVIE